MSEETDKTALLNPEDEIVRLKQELKAKEIELRRVTMARDAYERMIEIAEEKYAIPIRKNSDAKYLHSWHRRSAPIRCVPCVSCLA